jgi:hypothetical protein
MARAAHNIGFEEDIKGIFRQDDRDCMLANSFPQFDLFDWQSVRGAAQRILQRLESGDMPPDGPLPADVIARFRNWIEDGSPKRRPETYAAFFRDLDSFTEYWDVYRPETNGKFMDPVVQHIFPKVLVPWRNYALATGPDKATQRETLLAVLHQPPVSEAVMLIDDLQAQLITTHFGQQPVPHLDSVVEAQLAFGKDTLPLDPDRDSRIQAGDPRKPFAKFHRMDSPIMWFNWAAHVESAALLQGETGQKMAARTLLMAGVCGGSSMDFTFRDNRLPTRPEYKRDEATERLIRAKTQQLSTDWRAAVAELHDLWRIVASPLAANRFVAAGIGRRII